MVAQQQKIASQMQLKVCSNQFDMHCPIGKQAMLKAQMDKQA